MVQKRWYRRDEVLLQSERVGYGNHFYVLLFLGEAGLINDTALKISKSPMYKKGDLVKHKIFGIGRVQGATKSGKEYKLKINFGGNKKEILSSFVQRV